VSGAAGSTTGATKAVILARGLGTRMRRDDGAAALSPEQAAAAARGMKGMVPLAGRPLLDYALSALADAGFREACLVIGPEHDAVRARYEREAPPARVRVSFAVQERPLGTADAVRAAEAFAADDTFVVVNADNLYPADALARLRLAPAPALVAFEADALVREGNVSADRIARFALLDVGPDGVLRRIVEKPDPDAAAARGERLVSMTCWLFDARVFEACRRIAPSPRGELELPDAVQWLVDHRGARFAALRVRGAVLDLSSRADVADVERRLAGVAVRP
jgi:dTDP-glucose pyrophosphorylase